MKPTKKLGHPNSGFSVFENTVCAEYARHFCLGLFADLSPVVHGICITNMSNKCHLKNLSMFNSILFFKKLGRRFDTRWYIKKTIRKNLTAFKCHWQRWTPKLHTQLIFYFVQKNWPNCNLPFQSFRKNSFNQAAWKPILGYKVTIPHSHQSDDGKVHAIGITPAWKSVHWMTRARRTFWREICSRQFGVHVSKLRWQNVSVKLNKS